jgi:hypothetical protein
MGSLSLFYFSTAFLIGMASEPLETPNDSKTQRRFALWRATLMLTSLIIIGIAWWLVATGRILNQMDLPTS